MLNRTKIGDWGTTYSAKVSQLHTQVVLIDTAPELMTPTLKAALLSDLIIIPCTPSPLDVESAEDTIDLIDEAEKPFMLLSSCVRTGTGHCQV